MNRLDADSSRCQYRNAAGRRCRSPHFGGASNLCPRHAAMKARHARSMGDLTELITTAHDKFRSPESIHASLAELFTLLAENRVAPRRAAVLAYIASLLLRTLYYATQQQTASELATAKHAPPVILWNIPGIEHPGTRQDRP